ncbi:Gfo/Idh/MocA family oxidoreductase [Castellaniella sp. GW247-6E4]|uniref:Gfo/Idh/MocA family protein n=1 Tax=Castellaniella sp. GW247-6E4 TaxID=3140380 RepID=UPI003315D6C2
MRTIDTSPMIQKLKIAILGAGLIGRQHILRIQASASCVLSAVVDPMPAARVLAAEIGVPYFENLAQLFAAGRPDGVVIGTPNALHVEQALECLAAGVPALIEKPVAHTLAEGERLVRAVGAADVPFLVGHHRAHSPIMALARDAVRSGRLGRLVAVTGSAMFCKPDDYFVEAPWRKQPGGGPILINMIHEIDNLRALCGEIVEVQATVSNATRGFEVEDTAALCLRFDSGVLGTFLVSDTVASPRSWEQTSQENKAYDTYPDEDCYILAGTVGSLAVPTMRLRTYASAADRSWWKPFETHVLDLHREDPLALQIEHFAAVIRGEAQPLVSVRDGVQNLRVVEAIGQAAREGRRVSVPLPA